MLHDFCAEKNVPGARAKRPSRPASNSLVRLNAALKTKPAIENSSCGQAAFWTFSGKPLAGHTGFRYTACLRFAKKPCANVAQLVEQRTRNA